MPTIYLILVLGIYSTSVFAEKIPALWNEGLRASSGADISEEASVKEKKTVVIYFANDVHTRYASGFDLNIRTITSALEDYIAADEDEAKFMVALAGRFLLDMDAFNRAVDEERDDLVSKICSKASEFKSTSLAIFRNNGNPGMRQNVFDWETAVPWEFCSAENNQDHLTRKNLRVVMRGEIQFDPLWEAQPIGFSQVFSNAISAVKAEFPPETHRYILIIKSQGDENHFMTPWLSTSVRGLDPSAIATALLAQRDALTEADRVTLKRGRQIYRTINRVLSSLAPNPNLPYLSSRKDLLLEHIAALGGGDPLRGMIFPVILFDSPDAALEKATVSKLTELVEEGDYTELNLRNVGSLYTARNGGELASAPYQELFMLPYITSSSSRDFEVHLRRWLERHAKESFR